MGIVNTLCIIGAVVLARRRGGLALMFLAAVGIALMSQSLPSEALHDIWNPAAGLFPFLLLIFIGWSLACGDHRLLPLAALIASYVTQTHLMYAAPTAVALGAGCGGLLLAWLERRRRARHAHRAPERVRRRVWPWAVAAVVVLAACWTAPAIDEIENSPGNLSMIVNTVEHHGTALGSSVGWAAVVRSVGLRPWWLYVPTTEWDRKYDVGAVARPNGTVDHPSSGEVASAIVVLVALGAVGLAAAFMLQWELAAAALIGLGMCVAIGLEAASNPATPLLAGTLGYTLWWGSELGFWVWLVLAWALWIGLAALARPARRALRRRLRALGAAQRSRRRLLGAALGSLACLGGTVAVGEAVAATERPDSHHLQYQPVRTIAAGLERLLPKGAAVDYTTRDLDLGTQPMEPAIRFLLVRHDDRVLANGSFPRLGSYYELYHRHYGWRVLLAQGSRRQRHMTLAARVRFTDGWGHEVLSAWVAQVAPPSHAASDGRAHRLHIPRHTLR
jgi:hypothetical protein